jgi:hypothetical protein
MKEAADVLAESREYLEEHGWCRGEMRNTEGKVCAMGAICYSQHWDNVLLGPVDLVTYHEVLEVLMKVIRDEYHFVVSKDSIPFWNDVAAQNQQEVSDVFMKAEKLARSGNVVES